MPDLAALVKPQKDADREALLMLVDATCSARPAADIEKIHINVFKSKKIMLPKISRADMETLEILIDPELMKEIRMSKKDADDGKIVSWEKVRVQA